MPRRKPKTALVKLGELGMAVPQVVAHRVTRMALAGPLLSARDRQEFEGMVLEKQQAFTQAFAAVAQETVRVQQSLTGSWLRAMSLRPGKAAMQPAQASQQLATALERIAGKGLGPVHRKAVANAKRLSRTRLK
ncbi:MAG: hypothetical protein JNJ71_12965 [Rubrivivax sp.]|nr:hypothetical protein [Rubrivivax sp.]